MAGKKKEKRKRKYSSSSSSSDGSDSSSGSSSSSSTSSSKSSSSEEEESKPTVAAQSIDSVSAMFLETKPDELIDQIFIILDETEIKELCPTIIKHMSITDLKEKALNCIINLDEAGLQELYENQDPDPGAEEIDKALIQLGLVGNNVSILAERDANKWKSVEEVPEEVPSKSGEDVDAIFDEVKAPPAPELPKRMLMADAPPESSDDAELWRALLMRDRARLSQKLDSSDVIASNLSDKHKDFIPVETPIRRKDHSDEDSSEASPHSSKDRPSTPNPDEEAALEQTGNPPLAPIGNPPLVDGSSPDKPRLSYRERAAAAVKEEEDEDEIKAADMSSGSSDGSDSSSSEEGEISDDDDNEGKSNDESAAGENKQNKSDEKDEGSGDAEQDKQSSRSSRSPAQREQEEKYNEVQRTGEAPSDGELVSDVDENNIDGEVVSDENNIDGEVVSDENNIDGVKIKVEEGVEIKVEPVEEGEVNAGESDGVGEDTSKYAF